MITSSEISWWPEGLQPPNIDGEMGSRTIATWSIKPMSRAMGLHVPDSLRDRASFVNIGASYVVPPVVTTEWPGPLICDGWDFGGDA